jgi:hypothetical protein
VIVGMFGVFGFEPHGTLSKMLFARMLSWCRIQYEGVRGKGSETARTGREEGSLIFLRGD